MLQLKITIVRQGGDRADLGVALAVMQYDNSINDLNMNMGVLKDDDGLLAVWELEEF